MTAQTLDKAKLEGVSPQVLALRAELTSNSLVTQATVPLGDLSVEVSKGRDSLWAIVRRPGCGGLALRLACARPKSNASFSFRRAALFGSPNFRGNELNEPSFSLFYDGTIPSLRRYFLQ